MKFVFFVLTINAIYICITKNLVYHFHSQLYDLSILSISTYLCCPKSSRPYAGLRAGLYKFFNIAVIFLGLSKTLARLYLDSSGSLIFPDVVFFACTFACVVSGCIRVQRVFASVEAGAVLHAQDPRTAVRRLVQLVGAEKALVTLAVACLVVAAVSGALVPHYVGAAVASASSERDIWLLVASASIAGLFAALRGCCFIILGARTARRLRKQLLTSLLNKEIAFFDATPAGELQSRLTLDVQKVADQIQFNVNYFSRNLLSLAVVLGFMFGLCGTLATLVCVCLPVSLVFSQVYGEQMKRLQRRVQDQQAEVATVAEEALRNVRTVRSFAAEHLEVARYASALDHLYALIRASARLYVPYISGAALIPALVTVLVILFGSRLVAQNAIHSSVLISFLLYLQMLSDNIAAIGDIAANLNAALGAAEKVFAWLDTPSAGAAALAAAPAAATDSAAAGSQPLLAAAPAAAATAAAATAAARESGTLTVKSLSFRFPQTLTPVVSEVSFELRPGRLVALVGPSGSGKSTVFALLQRHYRANSGGVYLDGRDIQTYAHDGVSGYERRVSVVAQEPALFNRSVAENIVLGLPSMDVGDGGAMEGVREAARLANAEEFILKLPRGYATLLGPKGGVTLSGGQKQRIAIARALVRKPQVLLLDEATSALDSESEAAVQEAIERLTKTAGSSLAVLVIAHRLSTVKNADTILVMDRGRIVETGTHAELLHKQPDSLYRKLAGLA